MVSPVPRLDPVWLRVFGILAATRDAVRLAAGQSSASTGSAGPGHAVPTLRFIFPSPTQRLLRHVELAAARDTGTRAAASLDAQIRRTFASVGAGTKSGLGPPLFVLPPPDVQMVFFIETAAGEAVASELLASSFSASYSAAQTMLAMFSGANMNQHMAADHHGLPTPPVILASGVAELVRFVNRRAQEIGAEVRARQQSLELKPWFEKAAELYKIMVRGDEAKSAAAAEALARLGASKLDGVSSFSRSLCESMLVSAVASYQSDLPTLYREAEHTAALQTAVQAYRASACGPEFPEFLDRLVEECNRLWADGRQLCESTSLLGGRCCRPRHPVDGNHGGCGGACTTGRRAVCTCPCGREQREIEEPFSLGQANIYFAEEECCGDGVLQSRYFRATTDDRATSGRADSRSIGNGGLPTARKPNTTDASTGGSTSADRRPSSRHSSALFDESALAELLLPPTPGLDSGVGAVLGEATEPTPAFKLCKIGTRSNYNPRTGLSGPGFVTGANFMMPWDVLVPSPPESGNGGAAVVQKRGEKSAKSVWGGVKAGGSGKTAGRPQTTRCYIGYEYECCRGYRFLDSGPNRRVQVSQSGHVKGTATTLLKQDMPIFVPCPGLKCARTACFAQLSRLHIATPKVPVSFGLIPRIQLRPAGRSAASRALVVHTSGETIWFEPDSYYNVLFPRIFAHDGKAIIVPKDNPDICLLKRPFIFE